MNSVPLLQVEDLVVKFGKRSRAKTAVDEASFSIGRGETLGLVGESGSGKSTIGRAIAGLVRADSGRILLEGHDITHLRGRQRRALASRIQVVFQDPYSSMNPALTVDTIMREPVAGTSAALKTARVIDMLERVGMPRTALGRYIGSFSGGQRQRIAIARALISGPSLVICDEPVAALDLSIQAQVLNLLKDLQAEFGTSYLFIGHNLDVARLMSDRMVVLYHGRLVEEGSAAEVIENPSQDYTRRLVGAILDPDPSVQRRRREARLAAAGPARASDAHQSVRR